MSLTAYVRYDNTGRIVPGGPIVTSIKPKVGDWVAVNEVLTTTPNYKLRGFIRYIKNGDYVAGSLILQHNEPQDGNWKEVYVLNPACCATTTTTTSSTSTTTTTTTAIPCTCVNVTIAQADIDDATGNTAHNNNEVYFATSEKFKGCGGVNIDVKYTTAQENVYCIQTSAIGLIELYYFKNDVQVNYPATVSTYTVLSSNCTTDNDCTPTTTTSTTIPPPVIYYYNVNGYGCGDICTFVGTFTVQSPTPLTLGYFYNNPENRGYTFEIIEEIAPTLGGYDLTGEPGYATCTEACP